MKNKLLGQQISLTRKDRGLTSEKLSEICYIDAAYLRQIESGNKIPSLPVLVGLCNALHVSPNYLLYENLERNELSDIAELILLWNKATPSQIEMSTIMIKAALEFLQKK